MFIRKVNFFIWFVFIMRSATGRLRVFPSDDCSAETTDYPVSALSFIRIWCLGQWHYISWVIDRPKFCPFRASRRYRRSDVHFFGRLIFRRARHININSMYEICQNEFRLGAAAPDYHFSSRGECDLDVKYRCIIARAREEYQVGRSIPASAFSG